MTRRTLNHELVVAGAADLADRDGLDAVSVSNVARHFDVQPASLYSHVRDHATLLDGVQQLAAAELADEVSAALAGRSGQTALIGLGEAHRGFARGRPGRWAALQRIPTADTCRSAGARRLATLMWAVLRGYELGEAELAPATSFTVAVINGFLHLERIGGFQTCDVDPEQAWTQALAATDVALRHWPTPEGAKPR